MDLGLDGDVVWITGASGGIGRALATAFAGEGARLALLAGRSRTALEDWVDTQDWRARASVDSADVRDPDAVGAALERLSRAGGPPRHAVVNAGIWPEDHMLLKDTDSERIRRVIEVNLLGALWTARAFLAATAEAGLQGTTLTFIGSTAGQFGEAGHVTYAASKGAMRSIVLTLKNEIVRHDPAGRVNLVDPGWTETPMAAGAMEDASAVEQALKTTPLHRVGQPEDVANTCVFLTSRQARHLTGQVIGVHGGMEGRVLW